MPAADPAPIHQWLRLLHVPGTPVEVRCFDANGIYGLGLFDDHRALAAAIARGNGTLNTYISLQRLRSDLALRRHYDPARTGTRARNELGTPGPATKDADVIAYQWLPIDLDPIRDPDTAATDVEHVAALAHARTIREHLTRLGWPQPIVASSGNGTYVLYHIALPVEDADLVRRVLEAIKQQVPSTAVKLDTSMANPSRIIRVMGLLNMKGPSTTERPHRVATVVEVPPRVELVAAAQLVALAGPIPARGRPTAGRGYDPIDVVALVKAAGMYDRPGPLGSGKHYLLRCHQEAVHSARLKRRSTTVCLWEPKEPGGPWRYADQRNHCQDATIADLLRHLGIRPRPPVRDETEAGGTVTQGDLEAKADPDPADALAAAGLAHAEADAAPHAPAPDPPPRGPGGSRTGPAGDPKTEAAGPNPGVPGAIHVAPYAFTDAFPAEHFVSRLIRYAAERTDAAHEYHEAAALVGLAAATPGLRVRLGPYPRGLPTNLYVLLIGESTRSRKSTSSEIAQDLHLRALPRHRLPDLVSPEGFTEELAAHPDDGTVWYLDEFGGLLDKLHHAKYLAGLREALLTLYGGPERYRLQRHSKRIKGGATVEDADQVDRPHLSILGATTPAVFQILEPADVLSGLLPRFAIVMPGSKPARKPFYALSTGDEIERNALVKWLQGLHEWARTQAQGVDMAPDGLHILDTFAAQIESLAATSSDHIKVMLERLSPMAIKVAILAAAGHPGVVGADRLIVTAEDARAAIHVCGRWQASALSFANRVGESRFERNLQRCLQVMEMRPRLGRRIIARSTHLDKKTLDLVEATLVDRGEINVERVETGGRPGIVWERAG
jgi:hypothetical protein